jgi:hypothetical protein
MPSTSSIVIGASARQRFLYVATVASMWPVRVELWIVRRQNMLVARLLAMNFIAAIGMNPGAVRLHHSHVDSFQ